MEDGNTKDEIIAAVQKSKDVIAKERYELRDLISDAEEILWNCDSAVEDLERAIDTLSEHL